MGAKFSKEVPPETTIPIVARSIPNAIEFTHNGASSFLYGRIERPFTGCPVQLYSGYGTMGGYVNMDGTIYAMSCGHVGGIHGINHLKFVRENVEEIDGRNLT
jgi:allophanate hydrolase subunit 2